MTDSHASLERDKSSISYGFRLLIGVEVIIELSKLSIYPAPIQVYLIQLLSFT